MDPVIGAAVVAGCFGLAGIALQNRRLLRENRQDHAVVADQIGAVHDEIRDTRGEVRDVKFDVIDIKADVRDHGRRLTFIESAKARNNNP